MRELKGFTKVSLAPGEKKTVKLTIGARSLCYCDVLNKQWKADAGRYDVQIGASSRDIRLTGAVTLKEDWTEAIPGMRDMAKLMAKPSIDLAVKKVATASSVEGNYKPEFALDGDPETRWGSTFSTEPQWIAVDLGKTMKINQVHLEWENAYASAYQVQVSNDGQTWKDVAKTEKGGGSVENVKFDTVETRWVRLYCTKRGTEYGYSLWSFEVYGPEK